LLTSSGGATIRKKKWTGFLVDGLEVDALALPAERDAELVHDERPAVRDGDAAADPGGAEVLAPLEHLEEHPLALLVQLEERDQLLEHVVLRGPLQLERYGVFGEELAQFHRGPWGSRAAARRWRADEIRRAAPGLNGAPKLGAAAGGGNPPRAWS
jgi:hypothetical protein